MANRVGTKIFPRKVRRRGMLPVGTETDMGEIVAVRKKTAKYACHYLCFALWLPNGGVGWFRRDQLGV